MARKIPRSDRPKVTGLTIERWAHGGDGVALPTDGPLAGRVVFVSGGVVPGDRVAGVVVKRKARWARVQLGQIEVASPHRVEPHCQHQHRCGGCPWMVGDAESQRTSRSAILVGEARKHLGLSEAEASNVVRLDSDTASTGYRRKVRLRFDAAEGRVTLGYRARRGHSLVNVQHCAVAHSSINAALPAIREAIAASGHRSGEVHLLAGDDGVAAVISSGGERTVVGSEDTALRFSGIRQSFQADQFVQANRDVIDTIVAMIETWARRSEPGTAVELFAGGGTLTPGLWRAGHTVTAYELDRRGAASFQARAAACGQAQGSSELHGCDLLAIGVPLPAPVRPEIVLLDPPRAGAASMVPWLRACGAERIIYISCDVATAMRDLAELTRDGRFDVQEIVGFDVAPHTGHQELAVLLERPAE